MQPFGQVKVFFITFVVFHAPARHIVFWIFCRFANVWPIRQPAPTLMRGMRVFFSMGKLPDCPLINSIALYLMASGTGAPEKMLRKYFCIMIFFHYSPIIRYCISFGS